MADPEEYIYSLREAAIVLIKQNNIHEGYWSLAVEFQLGVTLAAPQGSIPLPTGMVSVSRIGLKPSEQSFQHAVNAAEVNPAQHEASTRSSRPKRKTAD